jgi:hypothetical protein
VYGGGSIGSGRVAVVVEGVGGAALGPGLKLEWRVSGERREAPWHEPPAVQRWVKSGP